MAEVENKKIKVLIVEDEPVLGKLCCRIMEREGFESMLVGHGLQALEKLSGNRFDVCLSDIKTPVMNGMELYRILLHNHPALARKTLFMTGDVMNKDIDAFLEKSGARFILKPFTDAQLCAAIKNILKEP